MIERADREGRVGVKLRGDGSDAEATRVLTRWLHALIKAESGSDGIYPGGILPRLIDLAGGEQPGRRLHALRIQLVKLLESEGIATRDHPQDSRLHMFIVKGLSESG